MYQEAPVTPHEVPTAQADMPPRGTLNIGESLGLTREQTDSLSNAAKLLVALTTERMQHGFPDPKSIVAAQTELTGITAEEVVRANKDLTLKSEDHPEPLMEFKIQVMDDGTKEYTVFASTRGTRFLHEELVRLELVPES